MPYPKFLDLAHARHVRLVVLRMTLDECLVVLVSDLSIVQARALRFGKDIHLLVGTLTSSEVLRVRHFDRVYDDHFKLRKERQRKVQGARRVAAGPPRLKLITHADLGRVPMGTPYQ